MTTRPPALDLTSVLRLSELGDYIVPMTLRVVADLGVADLLADGPLGISEISDTVGAHAPSLLRALRALAAREIFTEAEDEVFALTPLAQPLRSDHPMSLRDSYTLMDFDVNAWAALDHSIRTGEPAFDHVHGRDYWTYLAENPRDSARVDAWMRSVNRLHLRTVLGAYPWGTLGTLVDVGGGNGSFVAGLLRKFPTLTATLLDLPHVVAGAPAVLAEAGVTGRCVIVPGSFFDAVPAGADAYLLKTVLPGFSDDDVVRVLRRVRAAMGDNSRVLLLEALLPPGDTFDVAKLFDVHTLALTGGAHRSRERTEELLARAGLRLHRVVRTPTLTILEAQAAVTATGTEA